MVAFADTFRTTSFNEAFNPASPSESWSLDQGRATRIIDTAWTTRRQATLDFMGYAEILNANGGNYLSRTVPANYPGESYVWCTGAPKVEGIGSVGKTGTGETMLADYQIARISLAYSTPTYEIFTDDVMVDRGYVDANGNPSEGAALAAGDPRYISFTAEPGMQIITFNRSLIKRKDTMAPISEGVPFYVPHMDIEFTWWNVPAAALNWKAWGKAQGKINASAFFVFEANTLLMEPPKPIPFSGPYGDRLYNVKVKMRYKPQYDLSTPPVAKGWNYILLPTGNGALADLAMVKMVVDDGGLVSPYQTADFTTVFEPPAR